MKRLITIISILLLVCLTVPGLSIGAHKSKNNVNDRPVARADGSKWRIGYCESESFITYNQTLAAIVKGLAERGWITDLKGFNEVAANGDSQTIWNWLTLREVSPYIEFVDDGFYNLKDPEFNQKGIMNRLTQQKDIDIMLVMGGKAGALLSKQQTTNIFVFAASNAVRSGIIASAQDSGKDNVWAHMDEKRFERQISAFYDIVKFKKVGIVYEDSDNARIYSAVDELESLAKKKGFEIVRYHVTEPRSPDEYPRYYREVRAAYQQLAEEVDAVYVTIASLESDKLPELFQPFYEHKIPIFSQLGNIEVKNGALMTVSVMDEENTGRFGADNIAQCLKGAKPRALEQSFQSAPRITLNAAVAKKINFKLPFELLIVVDEVYK